MSRKRTAPLKAKPSVDPTLKYTGFDVYHMEATHQGVPNPPLGKEAIARYLNMLPAKKNRWWDGLIDGWPAVIIGLNRVLLPSDLDGLIENIKADAGKIPGLIVVHMQASPDVFDHALASVPGFEWSFIEMTRQRLDAARGQPIVSFRFNGGYLIIDSVVIPTENLSSTVKDSFTHTSDWRILIDWIMIDWNWDGRVIIPRDYDLPEKDQQVSGRYLIPEGAAEIRVKLVDIRGIPWEVSAKDGAAHAVPARQRSPFAGAQQRLFGESMPLVAVALAPSIQSRP